MERNELKKHIPYGYGKVIAEKAGVSIGSVSKFLNGKTDSSKVEMAALEVVAKLNKQKKSFVEQIL